MLRKYIFQEQGLPITSLVELFKLKFKLYLRVTEISPQAATGAVESDTYPVICLILILTYFVYIDIPA